MVTDVATSSNLACVHVAAVSFPFPGGDQTSERKSLRAKKHARSEQKLGRSGEGVSEKGEGVGRKVTFSPHPLPLLLIFRTPFFVSFS